MADTKMTLRMPGEDYIRYFQPRGLLDTYYRDFPQQDDGKDYRHWLMNTHHQTFKSGKFKGRRLLDVGTGPNIMSVLSASKYFPDITCTDYVQPFDVVVSCLCVDSACKTRVEYCACLGNMASLVKSGGGLILVGTLNGGTMYTVGKEIFYNVPDIDEDFLRDSLEKAGFENVEIEPQSSNLDVNLANTPAFYYLTAEKA
uniref:Uncharacterized protein n=1 Tax=Branchiostoma floridae TaxID=7739 RepID=C3YUJ1_BRAFL|eukprot:XP_002600099.1 hypothetical protein BRAFLDRAFT_79643 [Branchiostoma floridae]